VLAACRGHAGAEAPAPAETTARPLALLAAQRVIVAPTSFLRSSDALGWTAAIPRPRDYLRTVDDELAAVLGERGFRSQWIYPADLVRAMRGSPSYAVDPYALGTSPLRNTNLVGGSKLGDPLATQLRTMIALQDNARAVLVPVELRFDRDRNGAGVAVLRLALIDGRLAEVRWAGEVKSDPAPTFSRELLTTLAAHLADLIAAP
jgi:hypothetical protein